MSRARAIDYEQQRDAILAKAISAFAQVGYASASMADLAIACGTSKAGLYHYFPSKDAILFDALNRFTSRLVMAANQVDESNDGVNLASTAVSLIGQATLQPVEQALALSQIKLRKLIAAFMAIYSGSREDQIVLLNSVHFLSAQHRQIIVYQERQVVEAFARALQACHPNKINSQNRTALTMTLLSAINFSFAWLREGGPLKHEQYADWVAKLWIEGVLASRFEIA